MSNVKIKVPTVTDIKKKNGLLRGGPTQTFLTTNVKRISDPYTPMRTGTLMNTVKYGPHREYIEYGGMSGDNPKSYAKFQWHGWLMVGPTGSAWAKAGETKTMASPMQKLDWTDGVYRGGIRGHYWTLRAWQADGDKVVKETEKFMKNYARGR